jgi:glutathione S-transferase
MTTGYTLYGRQGSGSFAVQVALEEIGAPYRQIWVSKEASQVEGLRKINPTGKVPALVLPDGSIMFESAAMLIHLALTDPTSRLAPSPGTSAHALFLQWIVFLAANAYEAALHIYYPHRYSSRGEADADVIAAQGKVDFCSHLELINKTLNPYVLGSGYSIADTYLYMLASWYPDDKAGLFARFPALAAHTKLIASRPAVAKVDAEHAQ